MRSRSAISVKAQTAAQRRSSAVAIAQGATIGDTLAVVVCRSEGGAVKLVVGSHAIAEES